MKYTIVSEAGASVYSASRLARKELPDLDVSIRGAVSIARRLQDPLAELVKIEPKAIGVGLYQHDVNQKALAESLDVVIESAVNAVGADLNTASPALLRHISGIGPKMAETIVAHRDAHGTFANRKTLLDVKGLGAKTFEQAAGFLRLPGERRPAGQHAHPPGELRRRPWRAGPHRMHAGRSQPRARNRPSAPRDGPRRTCRRAEHRPPDAGGHPRSAGPSRVAIPATIWKAPSCAAMC